jgi:thiol-disulfide isomerase/thioredoxin
MMRIGITGLAAPALRDVRWIDPDGAPRAALSLEDFGKGYKILYFFQHWCPGCHARGFPALVRLVEALAGYPVGFAAIQTVFEGENVNTIERLGETRERYGLSIPFGHAEPASGQATPSIMEDYRTGGTPWFVVVDPAGKVVFDGFEVDPDRLVAALQPLLSSHPGGPS